MTPLAHIHRVRDRARVSGLSTIQTANAILLDIAPGYNRAQRHAALAVANLESGFGVSGSWILEDGTPSYNSGAITCNASRKGTAGCFSHGDVTADDKPTTYEFMAFNTMREGLQAFVNTWGREDTLAAASRGDAHGIAAAMYGHGYYTGRTHDAATNIAAYASAILGSARSVADAIGEPMSITAGGSSSVAGVPWWGWPMVIALVGGIFYRVLR